MKIWIVSMECAGLAEAGGVKNVVCSLCEEFARAGHSVTLFIPVFASSSFRAVRNVRERAAEASVPVCGRQEAVCFSTAEFTSAAADVVFIRHPAFEEKQAVYVYTAEEERRNPCHRRGSGHTDMLFLDALLSKAAAAYGRLVPPEDMPDIVHCHDAAAAVAPCYIAAMRPRFFSRTKCVVTIHNAGPAYHHEYRDVSEASYYTGLPEGQLRAAVNRGRVEPFLLAARSAALTSVSSYYAEELRNPENDGTTDGLAGCFFRNGVPIEGITNGIDFARYDPAHTEISLLPFPMNPEAGDAVGKRRNREFFLSLCSPEPSRRQDAEAFLDGLSRTGCLGSSSGGGRDAVYFAYQGRIVRQKGISVLLEAAGRLLARRNDVRFIIAGQGEPELECAVEQFSARYAGRAVYFKGYSKALARLAVASADFAVLPSHFEPCCLEDFIAQLYGTIPIAHATGGLRKIISGRTGFLYSPNSAEALEAALDGAAELLLHDYGTVVRMMRDASAFVRREYSWDAVARRKYLTFFENLLQSD